MFKKVKISYPFIILTLLLTVFDPGGQLIISWCGIVIHELGHLIALRLLRCEVIRINIGLTGMGIIYLPGGQTSYIKDIILAAAGPLANFVAAAVCAAGMQYIEIKGGYFFIGANAALGIFNLLPAAPMDGGRILLAFISLFLPPLTAERVSGAVSWGVILVIVAAGLFVTVRLGGNITLLLCGACLCAAAVAQRRQHCTKSA